MSTMSEKERVYRERDALRKELRTLRLRVGEQRKQIKSLRRADTVRESAVLRLEGTAYRKALSDIKYRLERGEMTDDMLMQIVTKALLLKGMQAWRREKIAKVHAKDAA